MRSARRIIRKEGDIGGSGENLQFLKGLSEKSQWGDIWAHTWNKLMQPFGEEYSRQKEQPVQRPWGRSVPGMINKEVGREDVFRETREEATEMWEWLDQVITVWLGKSGQVHILKVEPKILLNPVRAEFKFQFTHFLRCVTFPLWASVSSPVKRG